MPAAAAGPQSRSHRGGHRGLRSQSSAARGRGTWPPPRLQFTDLTLDWCGIVLSLAYIYIGHLYIRSTRSSICFCPARGGPRRGARARARKEIGPGQPRCHGLQRQPPPRLSWCVVARCQTTGRPNGSVRPGHRRAHQMVLRLRPRQLLRRASQRLHRRQLPAAAALLPLSLLLLLLLMARWLTQRGAPRQISQRLPGVPSCLGTKPAYGRHLSATSWRPS